MAEYIQIAPGLVYIHGGKKRLSDEPNGMVLIDGDTRVLIDTGGGEDIIAALPPESIDIVILTHYHPDHIAGADLFPDSQFWCHPADAPAILSLADFCHYARYDRITPNWEKFALWNGYKSAPHIDRYLKDGEILDFGRVKLTVIHTPGHSPGHLCFLHEESGTVFSSDIDLRKFGPWYGHPASDINCSEQSIEKIKSLKPRKIAASHTGIFDNDLEQQLDNYKRVIALRDQKIVSFLNTPRTREELALKTFFYKEIPESHQIMRYFDSVMVQKHVNSLFRRGLICWNNEKIQTA